MKNKLTYLVVGLLLFTSCKDRDADKSSVMQAGHNYPAYGGNKAGNRYSPLNQINVDNVKNLQVALMPAYTCPILQKDITVDPGLIGRQ